MIPNHVLLLNQIGAGILTKSILKIVDKVRLVEITGPESHVGEGNVAMRHQLSDVFETDDFCKKFVVHADGIVNQSLSAALADEQVFGQVLQAQRAVRLQNILGD